MRRGPRLPMEALAPYLLEFAEPASTNNFPKDASPTSLGGFAPAQIFGNSNPVEIEVGFGKGLFLLNSGKNRPQTNFLGIEIERKYALYTATRVAKLGLHNVKLAACDARWFLENHVEAAGITAIHVYFPDPWWKNRHRKRRLFTEAFAVQCARILSAGGHLHLVSDVQDYFEESARMLANIKEFASLPPPQVRDPQHEMDFLTNFERKYRKEGRPIYRGAWKKAF